MTNALQQLLNEHVDEEALQESSATLDSTEDMLHESLAEAAGVDAPVEGEFDHLQTYNQDYLAGLSKEDLDFLHPDNTQDLNAEAGAQTTRELLKDQNAAVSNSFAEDANAAPAQSLLQGLLEGTDTAADDEGDEDDLGLDDDEDYTSDDDE